MTVNKLTLREIYTPEEAEQLSCCNLCPRECSVNRFEGADGYCGMDAGFHIASICIHRGEEPVISGPDGICNIFFTGCNLRCIYCQNHEISRGEACKKAPLEYSEVLDSIESILMSGIKSVGFVSPSHMIPQVRAIVRGLNSRGLKPVTVFNTNGYDKPETIDSLAGIIDVFLPDYKYASAETSAEFSDAADYPEVALKALKRIYYQKGSSLQLDENSVATSGMLIRHLVLPGHAAESRLVIRNIAEELSTGVHISLMSQYHPTPYVKEHLTLGRLLYRQEYEMVAEAMESLGFRNGWLQDLESYNNYRPDFTRDHPFE